MVEAFKDWVTTAPEPHVFYASMLTLGFAAYGLVSWIADLFFGDWSDR